jgi:hypothetical protein
MCDANGSDMFGSRPSVARLEGCSLRLRWRVLCATTFDRDRSGNCCSLIGGTQIESGTQFFHSLVHAPQPHSNRRNPTLVRWPSSSDDISLRISPTNRITLPFSIDS